MSKWLKASYMYTNDFKAEAKTSVPIITDVVSSNIDQGKVYNIMW
jgi:hypothetical protein